MFCIVISYRLIHTSVFSCFDSLLRSRFPQSLFLKLSLVSGQACRRVFGRLLILFSISRRSSTLVESVLVGFSRLFRCQNAIGDSSTLWSHQTLVREKFGQMLVRHSLGQILRAELSSNVCRNSPRMFPPS